MASRYVPDTGDIVWLEFDPQAGHRPALVMSPAAYNGKTGLMLCCPLSTRIKGHPFAGCIRHRLLGVPALVHRGRGK